MKKIFSILIVAALVSSCQKVINVDIKNATPQIVIEANMANDSSAAEVKISNTYNFSESNKFIGIANATVTITDEAGVVTNLTAQANGIYKSAPTKFAPEKTYKLKVIVDNKVYESSSTMPAVTNLDSVITFPNTFGKGVILVPTYFDKKGVKNYYRFVTTINDTLSNDLNINDDQFNDGIYAQQPLFVRGSNGGNEIYAGDKASVEMRCITAAEYLYWFSLQQNEQSTPANPTSNISGGALGYFSAHTSSVKTIIVK
jgi:Domain of unknown function (DUF4249)